MISSFTGQYAFLSVSAPAEVEFEGITYRTVRHAFEAARTSDPILRLQIAAAVRPTFARRLGRKVVLRPDSEVEVPVMEALNRAKFQGEPLYAQGLYDTGGEMLVDGNIWHDTFWGVCTCGICPRPGLNHLGAILMRVRDGLDGL